MPRKLERAAETQEGGSIATGKPSKAAQKDKREPINERPEKKSKKRGQEQAETEEAVEAPKKKGKVVSGGTAEEESGTQSPSAFRKAQQIIVDEACPSPFQTFDAAAPHFGKALVKALKAQGYESPTPIQAQAWPIALQGRDMVAVAKTGSGKTCAFLLPALARIAERGPAPAPKSLGHWESEPARPSMLVLAPTRELAQQIAAEGAKFAPAIKAKVVAIYGGVPKGEQVGQLLKGCDVLIATPGRMLDLAGGDKVRGRKPCVELASVTYLVLDEADKMLDMGFAPEIAKIVDLCPNTGKPEEGGGATGLLAGSMRQTLFFTATWPKAVQKIAKDFTSKSAVQIRIGQGSEGDKLTANADIKQVVYVLEEGDKLEKLKELLKTELGPGETGIVFAAQKSTCDDLTWALQRAGLNMWCKTIHSGRQQWDRDQALAEFRKLTADGAAVKAAKPDRGILVATDVASRGLDIPGVALVIVYDFGRALKSGQNGGVESYVHRIGRTGRAGKTGKAFTFFTAEDQGSLELVELLKSAKQVVPSELKALVRNEAGERSIREKKQAFWSNKFRGGNKTSSGRGKGGKSSGKGTKGGGRGRGY